MDAVVMAGPSLLAPKISKRRIRAIERKRSIMRASVPAILAVLLLLSNDSATGAVTAPLSPLCGTRRRKRITPSLAARSVRGGGRLAAAAIDNAEGTPRHGKKGAVVTTAPLKPSSSATVDGLKNALASGLAAACSKAILQPFDTLKTVQQQTRSVGGERGLGLAEAVRKITAREGGVRNLYVSLSAGPVSRKI